MFNKPINFKFPEHVLSQEEFYNLITTSKKELHNYMSSNDEYIKVFICDKETAEDRNEPGYLENCEFDEICYDYKNRYYVAQLKTTKTGYNLSIANLIWYGYHEVWSYAFDIYEMHRVDKNYKKLFIKDFFVCEINNRSEIWMYNDFINIYNNIKSLDRDQIEKRKLIILNEILRKKEIKKINNQFDNLLVQLNNG